MTDTNQKRAPGRPRRQVPGATVTRQWNVQCKAHAKSSGKRCTRPAMQGQKVCYQHGGAAPQNRAKGEKVMAQYQAEAHAARLMEDLAYKASTGLKNPLDALERLAVEVMANKDALAAMVNNLKGQVSTESIEGIEQVRAIVQLYNQALDRTMKVLEALLKYDIEGKKIKIMQSQAEAVAALVIRVLLSAGLNGPKLDQAKTELSTGLKELAAAEAHQ